MFTIWTLNHATIKTTVGRDFSVHLGNDCQDIETKFIFLAFVSSGIKAIPEWRVEF